MRAAVILSACLLLSAPPLHSCSCVVLLGATACDDVHSSDIEIIASGRVAQIDSEPRIADGKASGLDHVVHLRLDTIFRGSASHELVARTDDHPFACGFPFALGEQYLVYAYRTEAGQLRTSTCHPTKLLAEAIEDLDFLNDPESPRRTHLAILWLTPGDGGHHLPVSGEVRLLGADGYTRVLQVPASGRLRVRDLPEGSYSATALPDSPTIPTPPPARVHLASGTCSHLQFVPYPQ